MTEIDTELLPDTFIGLADTMVTDFDVTDFLHMLTGRSVRLLPASAAGVLLADPRGQLRVAAASSEAAGLIELFQIQNDQGPCLDCLRTGQPVTAAGLDGPGQRWPRFAAAATRAGFGAVNALPMRLRDHVIGALNSRTVIEQAKDRLAERTGLDMNQAFTMLRQHARNTNQRLTDIARHVIDNPAGDFPASAPR